MIRNLTDERRNRVARPTQPGARRRQVQLALALAVLFVVAITLTLSRTSGKDPQHPTAAWKKVFFDGFDSPTDLRQWTLYNGIAPNSNPATGWWSATHVSVSDGQLVLAGHPDTTPIGERRIVTGGAGLYSHPQVYGKWIAKVRFDSCSAVKYAILLWPVSGHWPADGEVDFAEDQGGSRRQTTASLIFPNPHSGRSFAARSQTIMVPATLTRWHTVGVEWTPAKIRYTLDGHYWGKPLTDHIPKTPMAFVAQTEAVSVVGTSPGLRCNGYVGSVTQYRYQR